MAKGHLSFRRSNCLAPAHQDPINTQTSPRTLRVARTGKTRLMKINVFNATSLANDTDLAGSATGWVAGVIARLRKAGSDRALRRQLAEMDDALLRDIGIGEDEIWRVRAQQDFTPRSWH